MAQMYVACESGALDINGERTIVHKDHTRVDAGHALVKKYPEFFQPLEAHFRVENSRQAPDSGEALKLVQKERDDAVKRADEAEALIAELTAPAPAPVKPEPAPVKPEPALKKVEPAPKPSARQS